MKDLRFETIDDIKKKVRSRYATGNAPCETDISLVDAISTIRERIDVTVSNLNNATDPLLIEGYVYELKSLNMKYDYFLKQCKERGITADFC